MTDTAPLSAPNPEITYYFDDTPPNLPIGDKPDYLK